MLPIIFVAILHFVLCIVLLIYALRRKTTLRKEYIIPIVMLPIFGPLSGFLAEQLHHSGKQGKKINEILLPPLEDDILWQTVKSYHETGKIVPLEEALLINENGTKRKMMLNALHDDPLKYMDVLRIASHNPDVETAHYATTTISHSQRKFQLELQKTKAAIDKNPKSEELLDYYLALLQKYIDSGLLEEHLLQTQRLVYSDALDKKLTMRVNDKATLIKKLRNSISLKDLDDAFTISEVLKNQWPEDEAVWDEVLRVCVESKDRKKLQEAVDELQRTQIQWTKQGKEKVNFWIEGAK